MGINNVVFGIIHNKNKKLSVTRFYHSQSTNIRNTNVCLGVLKLFEILHRV